MDCVFSVAGPEAGDQLIRKKEEAEEEEEEEEDEQEDKEKDEEEEDEGGEGERAGEHQQDLAWPHGLSSSSLTAATSSSASRHPTRIVTNV